jgi:hypothetical protein
MEKHYQFRNLKSYKSKGEKENLIIRFNINNYGVKLLMTNCSETNIDKFSQSKT